MIESSEPAATHRLSGEMATELTDALMELTSERILHLPVSRFQILAVLSRELKTMNLLSFEDSIEVIAWVPPLKRNTIFRVVMSQIYAE